MERAVVVGISLGRTTPQAALASLEELKRLLETAGGEAVATVVQHRPAPEPATMIGKGKVEEVAALVRREKADLVALDEDLTPTQQRNLQERIPAKVVDRTRLILDIFSQRARTREGKLQVELAQLNYLLPRITERYGTFEQQTGGVGTKGGIGTRGPGERKLEVERRHIRSRILHIESEIRKLRAQRALQRQNRKSVPLPTVALVGYTNVGKSTLLNALTHARGEEGVYADDKLFATLDPTTRRVKLPGGRTGLFVDTVGFIQKLPHDLVAAFHATLEAVREANILVHVVDAADPDWRAQAAVVDEVLADLDATRVPRLLLFNKADRLTAVQRRLLAREGRLAVSARTGAGLDGFLATVERMLEGDLVEREFMLPHGRRDLLPLLYGAGRVISEKPAAAGTRIKLRIAPQNWGRVQKVLRGETKR